MQKSADATKHAFLHFCKCAKRNVYWWNKEIIASFLLRRIHSKVVQRDNRKKEWREREKKTHTMNKMCFSAPLSLYALDLLSRSVWENFNHSTISPLFRFSLICHQCALTAFQAKCSTRRRRSLLRFKLPASKGSVYDRKFDALCFVNIICASMCECAIWLQAIQVLLCLLLSACPRIGWALFFHSQQTHKMKVVNKSRQSEKAKMQILLKQSLPK